MSEGPIVEPKQPSSRVELHGIRLPSYEGGACVREKTLDKFSSDEMQIDHLMTVIKVKTETHAREIAELTLNLKNTVEYNNALVKKLQNLRQKIRDLLQLENF